MNETLERQCQGALINVEGSKVPRFPFDEAIKVDVVNEVKDGKRFVFCPYLIGGFCAASDTIPQRSGGRSRCYQANGN